MRFLLALWMFSCGGATEAAPAGAPDSGSPPRVPASHRAAAIACPSTRAPGHADALPSPDNKCATDADCTAGRNGRCYGGLQPNTCSYDECVSDADCRAAVCDCRNTGAIGQPNKCFAGTCRVDADCGTQYCSPSGTTVAAGCTGAPLGSFGYFCHTARDQCIDDSDCGDPITRCMFDPDVAHWTCKKLLCPR